MIKTSFILPVLSGHLSYKVSLHGQDKFYFTCIKWPLDKKVMVRTSFAEKKQKKKIRLKQCLPSFEGET
jgi:hypothetical protein